MRVVALCVELLFVAASIQAAEALETLPEKAQAYARFSKSGDLGFRDLEAIDIALTVQDATGNMFVTYIILDALLADD